MQTKSKYTLSKYILRITNNNKIPVDSPSLSLPAWLLIALEFGLSIDDMILYALMPLEIVEKSLDVNDIDTSRNLTQQEEAKNGFNFFITPEEKQKVFEVGKGLAEYAKDENVANIIFIDRAARPAYLAVNKYWNIKYPYEKCPGLYFLNPKGFIDRRVRFFRFWNGPDVYIGELAASMSGGIIEGPQEIRSRREVKREFEKTYSGLLKDREKPTILYDNCIHTGNNAKPIMNILKKSGFTDLRFAVASNDNNRSRLKPDFVVVDKIPEMRCYPFYSLRNVIKTYALSHSMVNKRYDERADARQVRQKISKIIKEFTK